jgi:hypothetical protein
MRDTIDMAREAGFTEGELAFMGDNFRRFEALVRADEREQGQKWFDAVTAQHKQLILAEREACAKVCDEAHELMNSSFQGAAAAIRARGTK